MSIPADQLPVAKYDAWYTGHPLTADPLDGKRFYFLHPDGRFFVSNDAGKTWSGCSPPNGPGKVGPDGTFKPHFVRPSMIQAGRVFVANDATGLFRSDDAGKTFTRIESVTRPGTLAIGPASDRREALYV